MKTSLDLPDELYRRVKSKSALEGLAVREAATALFAAWVDGRVTLSELSQSGSSSSPTDQWPTWLEQWRALTQRIGESDAGSGGLVEQLRADRR